MLSLLDISELSKWICVSFIFEFVFAYIDICMVSMLFKVETTEKKKLTAIVIDGILRFLFVCFIPNLYYRILNLILSVVIFKVFFKLTIEKSVIGELINVITILLSEVIFAKLFCIVIPNVDTYFKGMYNYLYKLGVMLGISIFRCIVYFVLKKKCILINIDDVLRKSDKISIITISTIGCGITHFNATEMIMYIDDFPYRIWIGDIFSIIVFIYITIESILKIYMLESKDREIYSLELHNKRISKMYDSIRCFRHDFSNFVQALDGYVKTNDIAGIRKMNESVTKEWKDVNNMEILAPEMINNSAVYNIIVNKYSLARKNNISMNLEVMTDLSETKEYTYEFCRILGILIDNAIEAAKKCDEKYISIRFIQDIRTKRKMIIIENTYNKSEEIDIGKIFEKGYTSKNDEENKHGLGLWTVRKILKTNKKLNLFTKKEELFCQQIEIYQ